MKRFGNDAGKEDAFLLGEGMGKEGGCVELVAHGGIDGDGLGGLVYGRLDKFGDCFVRFLGNLLWGQSAEGSTNLFTELTFEDLSGGW